LACQALNNRGLASHSHDRVDGDKRRKEEDGWIKEENGIMDIERGFPLFEILRLRMYSLESSESRCVFLLFFLLFL